VPKPCPENGPMRLIPSPECRGSEPVIQQHIARSSHRLIRPFDRCAIHKTCDDRPSQARYPTVWRAKRRHIGAGALDWPLGRWMSRAENNKEDAQNVVATGMCTRLAADSGRPAQDRRPYSVRCCTGPHRNRYIRGLPSAHMQLRIRAREG